MLQYWIDEDDNCKADVKYSQQLKRTLFNFPCQSSFDCKPYSIHVKPGIYKFELWGASGGDARIQNTESIREDSGGKGAYVSGIIKFHQSINVYLFIGGKGENQNTNEPYHVSKGGYNGGGNGGVDVYDSSLNSSPESSSGAGVGTDIRLENGNFDDIISLKSRIIVAGGGGSAVSSDNDLCKYTTNTTDDLLCEEKSSPISQSYKGGAAGALTGYRTNTVTFPGNQTSGSFGIGQNGLDVDIYEDKFGGSVGGGGGGYFGGTLISDYTRGILYESGGAGGSSYVSGCIGCRSVKEMPQNQVETSENEIHYSSHFFTSIVMKSGIESFYSPTNVLEQGHTGNGAIAITFLKYLSILQCRTFRFEDFIPLLFATIIDK